MDKSGKKVLMAVCNYFTNDNRVFRAANTLQEAGYNVTLLAYHKNGLKENEVLGKGFTLFRIKTYSFSIFPKQLRNFFKYIHFKIKAKKIADKIKPAFTHCHDYNTLFLGIYAKKSFKSKLIYDNHEYFQDLDYLHRYPLFIRKRIAAFERKTLKKSVDNLIVVSNGIKEAYSKLYEKGIEVIRNIPDLEISKQQEHIPDSINSFLMQQKKNESKLFLYLGTNIKKGRGIDFLLQLINQLPSDYKILIIGAKSESEVNYGNKIAAQYGVDRRIYIYKYLPIDILKAIAKYCYMGISLIEPIYFSYKYSLPNKIFEYIQFGLPVLSSNIPEQKKLIESMNIGLSIPFDILKAKEKIQNYMPDTDAIKKAKEILNWQIEKKKYFTVYSTL